ncbi:MAG: hypothetical protein DMD81_00065 [Candidatus Rokuibacteriota bacterium]|nr:MAG: hypothetical protein DMD81_00065 [Candidatus Rokubacteria bacterium]
MRSRHRAPRTPVKSSGDVHVRWRTRCPDLHDGGIRSERRAYEKIPIREQVEVLSLVGDIALGEDGPTVHAHVVVGKRDGTAHGGHLLEAKVWPTLEVELADAPRLLRKRKDAETGLALIDLDLGERAA